MDDLDVEWWEESTHMSVDWLADAPFWEVCCASCTHTENILAHQRELARLRPGFRESDAQ